MHFRERESKLSANTLLVPGAMHGPSQATTQKLRLLRVQLVEPGRVEKDSDADDDRTRVPMALG